MTYDPSEYFHFVTPPENELWHAPPDQDPKQKPVLIWIDDEPLALERFYYLGTLSKEIEGYPVSSEEDLIELIRDARFSPERVACIVQDINRPGGPLSATIGRYRSQARAHFPFPGPAGDLAFYLRDQLYPQSSLVFISALLDSYGELIQPWSRVAGNVFGALKPLWSERQEALLRHAIFRFFLHSRPSPLSKEGRWLLPVAEELASITAVAEDTLERMSPRQFEEMTAAIFRNHGFTTALTQATRDGGYDLRLLSRKNSNSETILVECKRYNPKRRIDVGIVRQLYGVKALNGATAAYLVTSSYVSNYAKQEFRAVTPVSLEFFERDDVLGWCEAHFRSLFLDQQRIDASFATDPID